MKLEGVLQQNIFELLDLEHLPQEKKDEIFQQAYDTVMNRIMLQIADRLDEVKLDELKALFEKGDGGAVSQFFTDNGIEIEQLATTETLKYKVELASLSEALKSESYSK